MKRFASAIVALLVTLGVVGVVAPPASAGTLNLIGATLSWDDSTLYMPLPRSCSNYTFTYANNDRGSLLELGMRITSRFGDQLADPSVIGVPSSASGTFPVQICPQQFSDGVGPYTITFRLRDYFSQSIEQSAQITFLQRPGTAPGTSTPTTATTTAAVPTVATSSLVTLAQVQAHPTMSDLTNQMHGVFDGDFTLNYFNQLYAVGLIHKGKLYRYTRNVPNKDDMRVIISDGTTSCQRKATSASTFAPKNDLKAHWTCRRGLDRAITASLRVTPIDEAQRAYNVANGNIGFAPTTDANGTYRITEASIAGQIVAEYTLEGAAVGELRGRLKRPGVTNSDYYFTLRPKATQPIPAISQLKK